MSYVIKDYAVKVINHYVKDTLLLENFPFWKFPFVKCVLSAGKFPNQQTNNTPHISHAKIAFKINNKSRLYTYEF